jgi:hypothetical protein
MTIDEQMKINQHDFVDSEIWDLIRNLHPNLTDFDLQYDGNIVNQVRTVLSNFYVNVLKVCTEEDFYPYINDIKK